jgi:hypothetical protein
MVIDARGLKHPEHIRKFKEPLEGLCAVYEDLEVLLDDDGEGLKRFEMYIRSCRANYTVDKSDGFVKVKIEAPFSMCG